MGLTAAEPAWAGAVWAVRSFIGSGFLRGLVGLVRGLDGLQALLELLRAERARRAGAVLEEDRRRAGHADLLAQRQVAVDRGDVARGLGLGQRIAVDHPVAPGQRVVLGAPGGPRLLGRVAAQDRNHEGVDGYVVHLLQRLLEALAVAAVRIGEDGDAALAVALLPDDRVLERQRGEIDRRELLQALLRHVAAVLEVEDVALDQVLAARVAVADLVADAHLPQPGDRAGADLVDLDLLGHRRGDAQ